MAYLVIVLLIGVHMLFNQAAHKHSPGELAEAQLFARVRDAAEASGDASFVAFGTLRP